jgi:uncharacterized damage-inducible protein DinB
MNMAIKDFLLPEYDHEMATTRKVIERVPMAEAQWKPHVKSMTMLELATHIVEIPGWVGSIVDASSVDMAADQDHQKASHKTSGDLLAAFDQNVAKARAAIESKSDAEMMTTWTLKRGEQVLLSMPKVGVLRSFLLNHLIHHRGQMSVYIRLKDIPVPSIYGPSADDSGL